MRNTAKNVMTNYTERMNKMEEKNCYTVIELLAEKVRELQLEVRLLKYENESLSKEIERLMGEEQKNVEEF